MHTRTHTHTHTHILAKNKLITTQDNMHTHTHMNGKCQMTSVSVLNRSQERIQKTETPQATLRAG